MSNKEKDYEDDLDEDLEDDDNDDEESSADKSSKDESNEDDDSDADGAASEESGDESPDEDEREKEKEKERRRAKNSRARQRAKESVRENRVLKEQMRALLRQQEIQAAQLTATVAKTTLTDIANQKRDINSVYNNAKLHYEKAAAEGDGATQLKANEIMLKAQRDWDALLAQENKINEQVNKKPESEGEPVDVEAVISARLTKGFQEDWLDENPWFDTALGDKDSRIAKRVDDELAQEGRYTPDTPSYWRELNRRLQAKLPHLYEKYIKGASRKTPSSPVGGRSEGSARRSSGEDLIQIPKELKKNLQEAGQWDNIELRKKALVEYKRIRAQAMLKGAR